MKRCIGLAAVLCAAALQARAGGTPAQAVDCPRSLQAVQSVAVEPGDPWVALGSHEGHPLQGVALYRGRPEQQEQLAPHGMVRQAGRAVSSWRLPPSDTPYWLACEYAGTSATFARPMPAGTSECKATYDARFAVPVVTAVNCR
jgi:hypothetical protein